MEQADPSRKVSPSAIVGCVLGSRRLRLSHRRRRGDADGRRKYSDHGKRQDENADNPYKRQAAQHHEDDLPAACGRSSSLAALQSWTIHLESSPTFRTPWFG